jgi:hypothetical protein
MPTQQESQLLHVPGRYWHALQLAQSCPSAAKHFGQANLFLRIDIAHPAPGASWDVALWGAIPWAACDAPTSSTELAIEVFPGQGGIWLITPHTTTVIVAATLIPSRKFAA